MKNDKRCRSLKPISLSIKLLTRITFLVLIISSLSLQANSSFDEGNVIEIQQSITGTITDADGQPIPGASVIEKGTTNGVAADFDGNYAITVSSANAVLVFSSIGFEQKEISVGNNTLLNITLNEDAESLDEVIVVAYGTSRKKDLTGAVAVISSDELNTFPATTVDQALQGKTAGVQITSNSGAPGASVSVNIRGVGSFGSTTPLYIVDGFPTRNINFINPNSIESISVLKDASATALYGVRASNGVVIIQTKQGTTGRVQVELNSFVGFRSQPKRVDVLDVNQFAGFATELSSSADANVTGAAIPYVGWSNPSSLRNIDWQDEIFSSAVTKSTTLNVRGGGEKSRFAFTGGIFDEEGTLLGSKYKRYDLGFNAGFDITDKVRLKSNIKYITSQSFQPLGTGRGALLNLFSTIPHLAPAGEANLNGGTNPTDLPVDANGNFGAVPDVTGEAFRDGRNWVARALENDPDNVTNTLLANIDAEWDIYGGLSTQLKVGGRVDNFASELFQPEYYRSSGNVDVRPNAVYSTNQSTSNEWLAEYLLKYKKTINEKHTIDVLAGVSAQRRYRKFTGATGVGFLNNDIRSISAADEIQNAFGFSDRRTLASTFARLNYSFNSKYYLTGTVRRDGVGNVFSPQNLWGVFPSFAAGWNIDEESFMEDSAFNILKFRASWGETGNFDGIQPFGFLSFFTGQAGRNDTNFSFDGTTNSQLGLAPLVLANGDLSWETQTQTNIGLEGELLDGKIYFAADYFNRESGNFLFQQTVPAQTGFTTQPQNGGTVVNKGLEFLIGHRKSDGDFTFDINANITFIDNEITEIDNLSNEVVFSNTFLDSFNEDGFWFDITRSQEGGQVGAFYGFVADGIFQNQGEIDAAPTQGVGTSPGDRRFKDLNNDGVINGEDRTTIGSPVPDFFGSLNLNFSYKNFDLGLNFYGSFGGEILNLVKRELESASGYGNSASFSNVSTEYFNNRWNGEGSTNEYARALIDDGNIQNNRASSYFVEDGTYFRLRNLNLGYSLPTNTVEKLGLSSLRIYTSAQNVFTITNYSGSDPEIGQNTDINGNSSVTTRGIDAGAYPLSRTFTLGLNLKF
ncbi:TonB-dependent receptor [uncultured Croceitalea sp.]|uniref:SusC/RagA family TonB-linked outer membrane protein n=1 Tax=uncultured Croceitalea sp. TaxID=1798908 RepID=UPI003306887B